MKEVVLPDGRFAQVRTIPVQDMAVAFSGNAGLFAMAVLASRVATLDGLPITVIQVLGMNYRDAAPIFHLINKPLMDTYRTQEGIA